MLDLADLEDYWLKLTGRQYINQYDYRFLTWAVTVCPREIIKDFMDVAYSANKTSGMAYVSACLKRWRSE